MAAAVSLVVAGYHYRANARLAAFLYRVNDFGANGVDHSYKAEEGKVGFHDLGRIIGGSGVISAAGSGKNAQCAVGQALVCLGKLDTHIIRHRNDLTARWASTWAIPSPASAAPWDF